MYYTNWMKRLLEMHGIDREMLNQVMAKGLNKVVSFDEGRGELDTQKGKGLTPHWKERLQGRVQSDTLTIDAGVGFGPRSPSFICFIQDATTRVGKFSKHICTKGFR